MLNRARVETILKDVTYPGLKITVGGIAGSMAYLQVQGICCDARTGQPYQSNGRKWRLSPYMTRSEVVQTCLKAVITYTEHEVREAFKYRNVPIFDPHYDVDELYELRSKGVKALDVREQKDEGR